MRHALPLALILFALLSSASVAQVDMHGSAGTGGRVAADGSGVQASGGLSPSSIFVDPMVVKAFEVQIDQVCILVLDPALEAQVKAALDRLGVAHHDYLALHMASILLPRDLLGDVTRIPGILTLYRNERMGTYLDHAAAYTGAQVVWKTYNDRGKGVTIMIVDSGIDGTHPDVKLGDNLVQNVRTTPTANGLLKPQSLENLAITDFDGHGTHVASIAAGTAKSSVKPGAYRGLANGARLVGFAAGISDPTTHEVSFESQSVLEAFNYAIAKERSFNISVVSNSWGANGDFDVLSPINVATLQMYKSGLLVVFAAGNEGSQGSHTMNKYAVPPWVLSVAAGDYLNQVAKFSSLGTDPLKSSLPFDHPDITAPGVGITAAKASVNADNPVPAGGVTGEYTSKSGTSMAAPHVAGIAALLLSARPDLSPDDMMDVLTATATPMPGYETWEAGAGYVNALKAYQLAIKAKGHRDEFLAGKAKYAGKESGDPTLARDAVTVGYGAGSAVQLSSGDQSVSDFASSMVGTAQGLAFLVGTAILFPAAFGFGRRR
jgi:serine protease AprX